MSITPDPLAAQAEALAQQIEDKLGFEFGLYYDPEQDVRVLILAALRRVQTERQQVQERDLERIKAAFWAEHRCVDAATVRRDTLREAAEELGHRYLDRAETIEWLRQRAEAGTQTIASEQRIANHDVGCAALVIQPETVFVYDDRCNCQPTGTRQGAEDGP